MREFWEVSFSSTVNQTFTAAILGLLALGLFLRFHAWAGGKSVGKFCQFMPSAVVSVGVLGTFYGIFQGLQEFNTEDVTASIPPLLDGLTTAFVTSICGMGASIILRLFYHFFDYIQLSSAPDSSDDPLVLLKNIKTATDNVSKVITQALGSDDETSVLTQMQKTRDLMMDSRIAILKAFDEFAKKIADQGNAELIKSLEKVMTQFNSLLNEMVGAAFDELKESVTKLNEWQNAHREQVDTLMESLTNTLEELEKTNDTLGSAATQIKNFEENIEGVATSVENLSLNGEQLATAVTTLNQQQEMFAEGLAKIKDVGQEAARVLPQLDEGLRGFTANLDTILEQQNQKTTAVVEMVEAATSSMSGTMQKQISDLNNAQKEQQQAVEQATKQLQDELEIALTHSMRTMVAGMSQISEKFAQDYTPLSDRLREVLTIAEELRGE